MSRPLVSVVTPTWQRRELAQETIYHVRDQDYPNIEHIIVSDGADEQFYEVGDEGRGTRIKRPEGYVRDICIASLGRNWSGIMPESFGIAPLTVGYLMARGDLVMPWCDDERALVPDHISRLVDLLLGTDADFVYPEVRIWRNGDPDGPEAAVIGTDPPAYCQITHYLAYVANFWKFGLPRWGTHPVDWSLIDDWMRAGATWAFLPEVTFSHRLDR